MEHRITKLVDWFLFTSLFTACCATGLCMSTERLVSSLIPPLFDPLHTLIFGATLAVYNTHVLVRRSTPERSDLYAWTLRNRYWLYIFLAVGMAMSIASLFFVGRPIVIICIITGCLAFGYSVPVLPFSSMKQLRDIGIIKISVLAGVWTVVSTVLPILYLGKHVLSYPYEIIIRFVFIFILCVAFDVRDVQTDLRSRVNTVPILIGIKNSYKLINLCIVIFVLMGAIQYVRIFHLEQFIGIVITALITKWVVSYVQDHPSDRAYMGLVDGLMLLYAVLALLH